MNFSTEVMNIMLIGAMELALLFIVISLFLALQNRSLKKLVRKLKERMQILMTEIRKPAAPPPPPAVEAKPPEPEKTYKDYINQHIKTTQSRHMGLNSDQDISLDIDAEVPLPRRVAAFRFAVLQAEFEANQHVDESNWEIFESKYEQLFSYLEDYKVAPDNTAAAEEIELLNTELTNAKQRINNLEKFKALYMDLDDRWQSSKNQAKTSYSELSQMADQLDDSESYERLLNNYQGAYEEFGEILERGIDPPEDEISLEKARGEIRHLRAVAAEQQEIITDLQTRLKTTDSEEEKAEIVGELQGQLDTQMRFVQESETCIKLMEDELTNANKELEQLRARTSALPNIKAELKDLRDKNDELDQLTYSLRSDNRRLKAKLEQIAKAPARESPDLSKYKRALGELQSKYNDLEEKYLDIKMQE